MAVLMVLASFTLLVIPYHYKKNYLVMGFDKAPLTLVRKLLALHGLLILSSFGACVFVGMLWLNNGLITYVLSLVSALVMGFGVNVLLHAWRFSDKEVVDYMDKMTDVFNRIY